MLFRKELNKYLKNTVYKYSLANKLAKNNCYILYNYTPALTRRDNSFKFIITPNTIKDI